MRILIIRICPNILFSFLSCNNALQYFLLENVKGTPACILNLIVLNKPVRSRSKNTTYNMQMDEDSTKTSLL